MKYISKETLKKLYEHGTECYPKEACGFVTLDQNPIRAINIQDELNKKDSNIYPRDSTKGYTMSLKDIRSLERSFKTENPAVFIYHSHPDVGAYFSQEDIDKALFMGDLIYDVDYLVLDINNGKAIEAKQFSFSNNKFICIATYDEDGKRNI